MNTSIQPDQIVSRNGSLRRSTISVSVTKPRQMQLGAWISRLRVWFDQHAIEPAGFKYHHRAKGKNYEVSFRDRHHADLFAAEFNRRTVHR